MNNVTVGKNIRKFRILKGLSQADLAELIGVSWEMISRYERGLSFPFKKLSAIAAALDVEVEQLFQKNFKSSLQLNDLAVDYLSDGSRSLLIIPEIQAQHIKYKTILNLKVNDYKHFIKTFKTTRTVILSSSMLDFTDDLFLIHLNGKSQIFKFGKDNIYLLDKIYYLVVSPKGLFLKESAKVESEEKIIGTLVAILY